MCFNCLREQIPDSTGDQMLLMRVFYKQNKKKLHAQQNYNNARYRNLVLSGKREGSNLTHRLGIRTVLTAELALLLSTTLRLYERQTDTVFCVASRVLFICTLQTAEFPAFCGVERNKRYP